MTKANTYARPSKSPTRSGGRGCRECRRMSDDARREARNRNIRRIGDTRRAWLTAFKLSNSCLDCGSLGKLEFDHREPALKRFNLGRDVTRSRTVLIAEMQKCDVVCHYCHEQRTRERRLRA